MTALDELYELARHTAQGVTEFEEYRPDPGAPYDRERPVAGFVIHGDQGSIGVLLYMPHPDGGSLTVHVQTFDASGEPSEPFVLASGNTVEVTLPA